MKKLLLVTTALIMSTPAFAADGFGERFGNSAPHALSDSMDSAIANTQGFGADDPFDPAALNQIDPAAGEEDAQAQEAELEAEAEIEAESSSEERGESSTEVEIATDTASQSEAGSVEIEPAAGVVTDVDVDELQADTGLDATEPVEE